ncbi:hypothetical protein BC828DRAFT_145150 [Blastocladiella britannica]|nr:hypothetical protein BC828DRAFT_145150 [Blastocladiella britannica]
MSASAANMRTSFIALLALVGAVVAAPADVAAAKESAVIAAHCPGQSQCMYQCYRACGDDRDCKGRCAVDCTCWI